MNRGTSSTGRTGRLAPCSDDNTNPLPPQPWNTPEKIGVLLLGTAVCAFAIGAMMRGP